MQEQEGFDFEVFQLGFKEKQGKNLLQSYAAVKKHLIGPTYQTLVQKQECYHYSIPFQSHKDILYSGRLRFLIFPLLIMQLYLMPLFYKFAFLSSFGQSA